SQFQADCVKFVGKFAEFVPASNVYFYRLAGRQLSGHLYQCAQASGDMTMKKAGQQAGEDEIEQYGLGNDNARGYSFSLLHMHRLLKSCLHLFQSVIQESAFAAACLRPIFYSAQLNYQLIPGHRLVFALDKNCALAVDESKYLAACVLKMQIGGQLCLDQIQ